MRRKGSLSFGIACTLVMLPEINAVHYVTGMRCTTVKVKIMAVAVAID